MKTVCAKNMCTGCMACVDACPKKAIKISDDLQAYNAVINTADCVECGICHKICQNNMAVESNKPQKWWQGWAKSNAVREQSSSGGIATAIEQSFVKSGGIVCSCVFEDGEFKFSFAKDEDEIRRFSGSKYVKSNPQGVYRAIKDYLIAGTKVLFVGLPCQVAAVKNYVGKSLRENLFSIDLVCHGTPSPKVLEMFLKQYDKELKDVSKIGFRTKTIFQINDERQYLSTFGTRDSYTIAFLNSISYTENCYHCRYAAIDRVGDITLGDSWGSELQESIQNKGVSLILCQTEQGASLLEMSEIELYPVDLDRAMEHNHQLRAPAKIPDMRNIFFQSIQSGVPFNSVIKKCYPKQYYKQLLKQILMKIHILGGARISYGIFIDE